MWLQLCRSLDAEPVASRSQSHVVSRKQETHTAKEFPDLAGHFVDMALPFLAEPFALAPG
jgi:hypothetical protein